MIATAQQLLQLYQASHYDIRLPVGSRSRIRIGESVPVAVSTWAGACTSLAIVSACNPDSKPLSKTENRRRMHALLDDLHDKPVRMRAGVGYIPGESWRESLVLVANMPIADVDRLARHYQQNAIVDLSGPGSARLRVYRTDWRRAIGKINDIDWANPPAH